MSQYKWINLRYLKCPLCENDIEWQKFQSKDIVERYVKCDCGFELTQDEFEYRLIELDMTSEEYHIPTYDENLEGLNNL